MRDLFVSYSSIDSDRVSAVVDGLTARGFKAWFDKTNILPSQNVVTEIDSALEQCSHFLLFASKSYFNSEWAAAEYRAALYTALSDKTTTMVIIKLDDVSLPPLLAPLSHILFSNPTQVCDRLADILSLDKSWVKDQSSFSTSKHRWELLDESAQYVLIEALFKNIGLLRQSMGSERKLKVPVNERLFFELMVSVPLISNEMLMADLESELRIFKILRKTVNSYMESLRKGGLGILQPAFEIALEEKMTELNLSRARINSQLSAIVPIVIRHEASPE